MEKQNRSRVEKQNRSRVKKEWQEREEAMGTKRKGWGALSW